MTLPISTGHFEALASSHERIKRLVKEPISTESLDSFVAEYDGPNIDVRALFPLFNELETEFSDFNKKYQLEEFKCEPFLASEQDATTITCYLNFLAFISLRMVEKSQYALFSWFIGLYPLKYYLAANTEVAIAALTLVNINGDSYEYLEDSRYQQYYFLCNDLRLYGFIPMYPNEDHIQSNYCAYLDPHRKQPARESIKLEQFSLEPQEVYNHTTMEIIEMGMKQLPREYWAELIYLARKAVVGRDYDPVERQQLIGLHALQLLQYERMCAASGFPQSNYTTQPYLDIFNTHLLQQFPKLIEYVTTIINHSRVVAFAREKIHVRIESEEIFLLALKTNDANLLEAILTFYQRPNPNWKTVTPMGAFMIFKSLESLNREHAHLPVQIAILKTLKQIIIEKNMSFVPPDEYIATIQSLISMFQHQQSFNSRLDMEISKGLLVIAMMLLDNDSSEALTIANDLVTLNVLAASIQCVDFELPAISCLCALLGDNMLAYNAVENYGLWSTYVKLSDPFALAKLYASLASTDKGKDIISEFDLRDSVIASVFDYTFNDNFFSQDYYSCVADAITTDPETLEQFGKGVPSYIKRVLKELDEGPNQSHYITTEDVWKQHSHAENVVDHCILLLSSVVHRDQIRKQLEEPEKFDSILAILSHQHLPYAFVDGLATDQYKHLLNELFLIENSNNMVHVLLEGLLDILKGDLTSTAVLQKMQVYIRTLSLLQLKKGDDFTKGIMKTILSDPNFQQIAAMAPRVFLDLLGAQYDQLTGSNKEIVSCFLFGQHLRFSYEEESKLFQLQQIYGIKKLGISVDEYNFVKSKVLPVVFSRFTMQRFNKLIEELVTSSIRSRLAFPPEFPPGQYTLGLVGSLQELKMVDTRDRYIFSECKFVSRVDKLWQLPYFVFHGGLQTVMDLWVRLHSTPPSTEKVVYECFVSTNYFEIAKAQLEDAFQVLNNYIYDWDTLSAVDPDISEVIYSGKCMDMRLYIVEQIVKHHPPISGSLHTCWWQDDCDPIAHLSQREYVLDNLPSLFENQDSNGICHGIYIVVEIIKLFEYQKPILDTLIPKLLSKQDLPSLAILAGIYTDPGLRYKALSPSCDELKPIFDTLFVKNQDDHLVFCVCQLLSMIPVKTLCCLDDSGLILSSMNDLIMQTTDIRTIHNILQLATLSCTISAPKGVNANLVDSVSKYCIKIFSEARFDMDSVMAYSILMDFCRSVIETDSAVLEMCMGYLIESVCPEDGIDTDLIEIDLKGYGSRSVGCFNSALSRYFMTDDKNQTVFPRDSISAATGLPLVLNDNLPEVSQDGKSFIDKTISKFIDKSAEFVKATKELVMNHIHVRECYFSPGADICSTGGLAELDAESTASWGVYHKAYFSLKLESEILIYLTLKYGAPVEYITAHDKFLDLLGAVSTVAGAIAIHSGAHRQTMGYRNHQRDGLFLFIKNLINCSPKTCENTVLTLSKLLEKTAVEYSIEEIALGIVYTGAPLINDKGFLKSLDSSQLLEKCVKILGLDIIPNRDRKYDVTGFYAQYCRLLTELYRKNMETYSKINKSEAKDDDSQKKSDDASHDPTVDGSAATNRVNDIIEAENDELPNVTVLSFDEGEGSIVVSEDGEDALSEDGDGSDVAETANDGQIDDEEEDDISDIMSYDSNIEEESDYEDDYYDSEYDDEGEEPRRVGGPFDLGDFRECAPNSLQYCSWSFTIASGVVYSATETLCHSFPCPDRDTNHLFYAEVDYQYLTIRGINVGPIYAPEDPKYIPATRTYPRRPPIPWFSTFGYESYNNNVSEQSGLLKVILRNWEETRDRTPIDWSTVPKWSPSVAEESTSRPTTETDETDETSSNGVVSGESTHIEETTENKNSYDVAVSKATYLLEHLDEVSSWGLDAGYLESLPEEIRLESIISYLAVYGAAEMSSADIRATLDDDTFYETALAEIQDTTKNKVPPSLKLSMVAHLAKDEGFQSLIKKLIWKEKPYAPKLTAAIIYRQGALLGSTTYASVNAFSDFSDDTQVGSEVLQMVSDKLESKSPELYMQNLVPFMRYFQSIEGGELPLDPIIDIMDNQQVLRTKIGFSGILECFHKSVEKGHVHEISKDRVCRILSVYLNGLISRSHRPRLRKDILAMVSKGYTTEDTLKQSLCARILSQLDDCIQAIKHANLSDDSFSGLETMLSALTAHPLCDFNEGSEHIVDRAIILGSQVSGIIANSEDAASSIRLLRCYLLLVTLTPNARSAFVAFVSENKRFVNRVISQDKNILKSCMANMNGQFDLFDYDVKLEYIRSQLPQRGDPSNALKIHRETIFSDSYKQVNMIPASDLLSNPFRVSFDGELGFDGGGLTKEWLTLLARELPHTDYGLFNKISGSGNDFIIHPNPQSLYDESNLKLYEFIGKIMAKAILLKQQFDCNVSRVVYGRIVSRKPDYQSLEELYLFDHELAKSLDWVLANDVTNVLMETFTTTSNAFGDAQVMELKPGGRDIEVTEENKREYVDLMIKHVLFTRVEKQIMAICTGFWSLIPYNLVKLLRASELQRLLCGGELDVDEWKSNTVYTGFTPVSLSVKYFWQAIKSMSDSEQRKILLFATGTDKVSAFGFSDGPNRSRFTISQIHDAPLAGKIPLPTASTCSSLLHLPEYTSQQEALLSLRTAIELGGIGFGFG